MKRMTPRKKQEIARGVGTVILLTILLGLAGNNDYSVWKAENGVVDDTETSSAEEINVEDVSATTDEAEPECYYVADVVSISAEAGTFEVVMPNGEIDYWVDIPDLPTEASIVVFACYEQDDYTTYTPVAFR